MQQLRSAFFTSVPGCKRSAKIIQRQLSRKILVRFFVDYSRQLRLLKKFTGKKILDLGCGDAGLLRVLADAEYVCTGIEYDKELVAKLSTFSPGINFLTTEAFMSGAEKYDIIHLGDVLEHINEPLLLLEQLAAKLSDGGIFFIEGPLETNANLSYYFRRITSYIKRKINEDLLRENEPYHVVLTDRKNQRVLFESAGLKTKYSGLSVQGWPYIEARRKSDHHGCCCNG